MKATITLKPKDIEQIIINYLTNQYLTVNSVKLDVSIEMIGSQMQEHQGAVFKGATCEVDVPGTSTNNFRSLEK